MRTIKFRAWDKKFKRMEYDLDWDGEDSVNTQIEAYQNARWEIMQFTGLTDKNGKEIYEGDIVQIYKHMSNEKHEVKKIVAWDNERCEYSGIYPNIAAWSKHEVIGNIYENPELLEK